MLGKPSRAKCLKVQPEFSRLDKSRSFFLRGLTLLVFLLTGAALFYINTHVQVVGIGYEIDQALAKKQNLIEENKRLSFEIARLRSPIRIETEARETLKLSVPGPHQWVPLSQLPASTHLFAKATETASPSPSSQPTPDPVGPKKPAPTATQQKSTSTSTKSAPKKVLLAKIIGDPAAPKLSTSNHVAKNLAKPKESVPAVLLDPMP
jgi:cell division protein FtsL